VVLRKRRNAPFATVKGTSQYNDRYVTTRRFDCIYGVLANNSIRSEMACSLYQEKHAPTVRVSARVCGRRIGKMCRNILIAIYSPPVYSCKKCKGTKTVKEKTRQEIHVERGMTNNQRIILAGAGDQQVSGSSQIGENSKTDVSCLQAGCTSRRCRLHPEDRSTLYF
jgi:hypothetical protein